jgi:hypothetical protein
LTTINDLSTVGENSMSDGGINAIIALLLIFSSLCGISMSLLWAA